MKQVRFLLFLLVLVTAIAPWVRAQNSPVLITGQVHDTQTQEPLIGVNVMVQGTVTGTITDADGNFSLRTQLRLPLVLVFSMVGFEPREVTLNSANTGLNVSLNAQTVLADEVVVTASRVEERIARSPVAIDKLDIRAIKETPAPTFFDALESVKGIQMTTSSMGFKVPNARGFNNTTNARFTQLVDGTDVQSPGIGAPIANTLGPTELDIESIEIMPGASSALYGMNALNGMINIQTKSPFLYQGLSVYQKVAVNHINDPDLPAKPFTETALRYAKAFNDRFAVKINLGYTRGTDWVANDTRDLNPDANASVGLTGADNPGLDPINSYGNENSNRRNLEVDGKLYQVRRTGYYDREITNYNIENIKADVALHYRLTERLEAIYTYKVGRADANYTRGNRIGLDDFLLQQHRVELKGPRFLLRAYEVHENSGNSYNMRPLGENLDRSFKSDDVWFADYKTALTTQLDAGVAQAEAHRLARQAADAGRFQPGTPEFEAERKRLIGINNWDQGAWLLMKNRFYQAEGQYDLSELVNNRFNLLVGADHRTYVIYPDGNSFINPDEPGENLYYSKTGGFVQISRTMLDKRLKVTGSLRLDKADYFKSKLNPRVSVVYTANEVHNFRVSYQNGYRFPTIFEGFSYVNNGGIRRLGGLPLMSQRDQIFENSYVRSSVDAFQKAVVSDVNTLGLTREEAALKNKDLLLRNTYTYLQPEHIHAFDAGYRASLFNNKLYVDVDLYFNIYSNFIDQLEVAVPNRGTIGQVQEGGVDSTLFQMVDTRTQERYRMWTNSTSITYNYGASVGLAYNLYKNYTLSGNLSYAVLDRVAKRDPLEAAFNTPQYIVNMSFGNRQVLKNLGYNLAWHWQDAFLWKASLANGTVPAYQTVDAQVTYRVPSWKATAKLGGSNLLNHRYVQYIGGPTVGAIYYLALTFDGLLN
ncbi:iron complex outermembrane recepter protein [Catalinimonas alkaloidigena]|uniref:Iron complex outermembrane recepter protein n=1 Tax=Catalinimonas alkaloidigena TaxID=1075417 RepID=A0A1G9BXE5_9BACT|nr:TonB-dependent receptor [Catalinimonas alkaloidigena]SDK44132.1 iron complex outermembrane recepter protein [Catalinimonas alkaloidigena]